MPKRPDIKKVMVIGSGPIVIGKQRSSIILVRRPARRCAKKVLRLF